MKKQRFAVLPIVISAVLTLALAGCGTGGGKTTPSPSPSASPSAATTPVPTLEPVATPAPAATPEASLAAPTPSSVPEMTPFVSGEGSCGPESYTPGDNPIDDAFAKDFEAASATPELQLLAETYKDAWRAELMNVSRQIDGLFTYEDDRDVIEDYVDDVMDLAEEKAQLEEIAYSDYTLSPRERAAGRGTGAGYSADFARAYTYRSAVLDLAKTYGILTGERGGYTFIYQGTGAGIAK